MAILPNVYVAMIMISSMGVISMSISYCPYAILGQYHEIKEVHSNTFNFVSFHCCAAPGEGPSSLNQHLHNGTNCSFSFSTFITVQQTLGEVLASTVLFCPVR